MCASILTKLFYNCLLIGSEDTHVKTGFKPRLLLVPFFGFLAYPPRTTAKTNILR